VDCNHCGGWITFENAEKRFKMAWFSRRIRVKIQIIKEEEIWIGQKIV